MAPSQDPTERLTADPVVARPSSPKRLLRRAELHALVPLSSTTIYEMEQRGEFPRRFNLTSRCVVWDSREVEAWIDERRAADRAGLVTLARHPDVHQRKTRPVRR